jgi:hypothetical protein
MLESTRTSGARSRASPRMAAIVSGLGASLRVYLCKA